MRLKNAFAMALLAATMPCWGSDPEFSLGLDRLDPRSLDPRTEARLAQWNSPMGRTESHVKQLQAEILAGGQPGAGAGGLAFRAKFQKGYRPRLVVGSSVSGVELYERAITTIRWPWQESEEPALPLEEQLALMLAERLRSSAGDSPAK
jgi:hypothetical protein